MDEMNLWIPHRLPGLNDYDKAARSHRQLGAAMKKEYTELVKLLSIKGRYEKKLELVTSPVIITFHWRERDARRDPDNIVFAKKFVLDGLVTGGVLPNDNQKVIRGFTEAWEVVGSWGEGVMVTIKQLKGEAL